VLVDNAGIMPTGSFLDVSLELADRLSRSIREE
jgi:hypothetical protein